MGPEVLQRAGGAVGIAGLDGLLVLGAVPLRQGLVGVPERGGDVEGAMKRLLDADLQELRFTLQPGGLVLQLPSPLLGALGVPGLHLGEHDLGALMQLGGVYAKALDAWQVLLGVCDDPACLLLSALAVQPGCDVPRHGPGVRVSAVHVPVHRAVADAGQFGVHAFGQSRGRPLSHLLHDVHAVRAVVGRAAGQDGVEDGAQAVDVAGRRQPVDLPTRLLGRHVGGGARHGPDDGGVGPVHAAVRDDGVLVSWRGSILRHDFRQPPVHDQDLTEVSDHDVAGLEVAVDDPAGVGKGHRLTDVVEGADETSEGPLTGPAMVLDDDLLEGEAPDLLHREVLAAVAQFPQLVHGDDAGVLQLRGGLRLLDEAGHQRLLLHDSRVQDLHRHGAVELLVHDPANLAEGALADDAHVDVAVDPGRWSLRGAGLAVGLELADEAPQRAREGRRQLVLACEGIQLVFPP